MLIYLGDTVDLFRDVFDELERMRKRLDYLMGRLWAPLETPPTGFPIDLSETDEEIIVRADLPGFEKKDVKIRATENTLEIIASRKEEIREKGEYFFRAERRKGEIRRFITLPVPVDYQKAKATMKNGVLTIRLPKKEKKKGKEIKIE